MPKKGITSGQLGVRVDEETVRTLLVMEEKHRVAPVDLARGLLEAACQFYREHGWFSFPVRIEPEAFQARYVAEQQGAYNAIPPTPKKDRKKKDGPA